jgi:hypothetical protein
MAKPCGRCGYQNAPHFCPYCKVYLCRDCVSFFGKCKTCETKVQRG